MEKNIKIGNKIYFVASDDNYLDAMGDNFEPCMVQLLVPHQLECCGG